MKIVINFFSLTWKIIVSLLIWFSPFNLSDIWMLPGAFIDNYVTADIARRFRIFKPPYSANVFIKMEITEKVKFLL